MTALRDAHQWLLEQNRKREAESVSKVLAYRLESTPAAYRVNIDLENIEELFSLSDAGREGLSKDICVSIAATLDYRLATRREPKTSISPNDIQRIPRIWAERLSGGQSVSVSMYEWAVRCLLGGWGEDQPKNAFLSFNYDCLVEESLQSLGYSIDLGLPTTTGAEASGEGSIPVLKLHGSVNWARDKWKVGPIRVFPNYGAVRDSGKAPELIPPTWRKLFAKELVDVWKRALVEVEQATRLVVIGFSMPETDLHFKYLIAAGLRKNLSLREIVFVDPGAEIIRQRAESMFGDLGKRPPVRLVQCYMSQFMNVGIGGVQVASVDRPILGVEHVVHDSL
jgi:hypothetical protein